MEHFCMSLSKVDSSSSVAIGAIVSKGHIKNRVTSDTLFQVRGNIPGNIKAQRDPEKARIVPIIVIPC